MTCEATRRGEKTPEKVHPRFPHIPLHNRWAMAKEPGGTKGKKKKKKGDYCSVCVCAKERVCVGMEAERKLISTAL